MRPFLIRLSEQVFQKINELIADGYEVRTDEKRSCLPRGSAFRRTPNGAALPGSTAKQLLRESRPKNGVEQRTDGTWLVYSLDDGCRVLYNERKTQATSWSASILAAQRSWTSERRFLSTRQSRK